MTFNINNYYYENFNDKLKVLQATYCCKIFTVHKNKIYAIYGRNPERKIVLRTQLVSLKYFRQQQKSILQWGRNI